MPKRIVETSQGPVILRVDFGLGRPPAAWRASLLTPLEWLPSLGGAIGATEDSAIDNS